MPLRLIAGLGNPGREYRDTRHNVGFMIVDQLAVAAGAKFKPEKAWKAEVALADGLLLCKPLTYMNLSGEAVRAIATFYKIEPPECLVVLDDMALPLGKLRFRGRGSAGGHNGLRSIIAQLGTEAVPRLRAGIGVAEPDGAVTHVLGKFASDEQRTLSEMIGRAVEAIAFAHRAGLEAAMNVYN